MFKPDPDPNETPDPDPQPWYLVPWTKYVSIFGLKLQLNARVNIQFWLFRPISRYIMVLIVDGNSEHVARA